MRETYPQKASVKCVLNITLDVQRPTFRQETVAEVKLLVLLAGDCKEDLRHLSESSSRQVLQ